MNKVIEVAKKYIGAKGKKFCQAYGLDYVDHWCVIFGWFCFKEAGYSKQFFNGKKCAYTPTIQEWLKVNCKKIALGKEQAGDICICTWSGNGFNQEKGSRDHFTMIRKQGNGSVVYTIEGNTGSDNPNASVVAEKTRDARWVYGIYRPNYPDILTTLSIDKKSTSVKIGKTKELEIEVSPKSFAKSVKWETSNKEVATVDKNGKVKGIAEGNCTIVAKCKDKTAKCSLMVYSEKEATYKVVSKTGLNMRKGPAITYGRIMTLPLDAKVKTDRKCKNWIRGTYKKQTGWFCIKDKNGVNLKKV